MRGILLAGGTGSRLGALTRSVNKHLLPIAGAPMVHHPLRVLTDAGIDDVTVVSSPRGVGQLAEALGSGEEYRCRIRYAVQERPGGVAQALACGWNGREAVAVILGDNVFALSPPIADVFDWPHDEEPKAVCYLKRVPSVERLREFGVPGFAGDRIITVEEKPKNPKSDYAVCGLYVLTSDVLPMLLVARPGKREEVEITDVLDELAGRGELGHVVVDGFWGDAGTPAGMLECDRALRGAG